MIEPTKVPLSIVVAKSDNGIIGYKGCIPWHIAEDLRYIRKLTMNKPLIMGRKTWESLPIKPLKGRTSIIMTSNEKYLPEVNIDVQVANDLRTAVSIADVDAENRGSDEIIVFGGSSVYEETMSMAYRIYMTEVHINVEGDTRFPFIKRSRWREVSYKGYETEDGIKYTNIVLERKDA